MAGRAMNRITKLVVAALLLVPIAACSGQESSGEPPLAGATIGGPFELTNQDGQPMRDTAFRGKYRIMYFGYTHCPDVCPLDMQNIAAGLRAFEKANPEHADDVVPIFVSVDPERDTPEKLKQFVNAFDPRIVGLTGTPEEIAEVARSYAVWYQKEETGTGSYLMNHTRIAYLMAPDGAPMAILEADESAEAVADTLAKWVK
jgi:protein SCO1